MATLEVVHNPAYDNADGTFTIAFRLTVNRKQKYKGTSYKIRPDQFREGLSNWVIRHPDAVLINRNLELKRQEYMRNLMDAEAGLLPMTHEAIFTGNPIEGLTVGQLLTEKADYYEQKKSPTAWRRMIRIKNELLDCWGEDKPAQAITLKMIQDYEIYLRNSGNNPNTINKKMSILAGLIDKQRDAGGYNGPNRFKLIRFPKLAPEKHRLTWDELERIQQLKLTGFIEAARDMFLFSFYAHGMRFENCLTFEKSRAKEVISYRMNKGKKMREIVIGPHLLNIINRYVDKGKTQYLFPFLDKMPADSWDWDYKKGGINASVNSRLKRVAIMAGVDKNISFHVARHTFASLLRDHQRSVGKTDIYIIQKALGHSDIKTTQMYLASLGDSEVNEEVNAMFNAR